MRAWVRFGLCLVALVLTISAGSSSFSRDKSVWNYEGGVFVITNGSIPDGPCFRLTGRVTSGDFFDHLKRIDKEDGTIFRIGSEEVQEFPEKLNLAFVVHDWYDQTCPPRAEDANKAKYLTREIMSGLHLYLYWKHGVEMRPVSNVERVFFAVRPIIPVAAAQAHGLPEKYEWSYEYKVPSAGVPLTDSLVLVLRDDGGHLVARVAARL